MRSLHRAVLAALVAAGGVAGVAAVGQTVHLGADARKPAPVDVAVLKKRHAVLTKTQRAAHAALAKRVPALPPKPRFPALGTPHVGPAVVTRVVTAPAARPARRDTPAAARRGTPVRSAPAPSPAAPARAPRGEAGGEAAQRDAEAAREARKQAAEAAAEAAKQGAEGGDR